MKEYRYKTNCVSSTCELLDPMIEQAQEITWQTFLRHVPLDEIAWAIPDFQGKHQVPHIKDDWAVSFHKSTFAGVPCYYIDHSAIEYVFVQVADQRTV